jgi:hypothetical protein
VQGHDGLSGTGAAADPRGPGVTAFDQLRLSGVEEHLPPAEVPGLQRLPQRVVGGGDDRGGPFGGGLEALGVDRLRRGERGGDLVAHRLEGLAVEEGDQHLAGELGGVLDQPEELLLGGEGAVPLPPGGVDQPYREGRTVCDGTGAAGGPADSGTVDAGLTSPGVMRPPVGGPPRPTRSSPARGAGG